MPLYIDEYIISRLSGPIVAHLLRPKRKGLPVLFLFGDRHNGMTKLCEKCHCKGPKDKDCCLEIYSPTFLQLLDRLSGKKKISIYTEFFEPKEEKEMYHHKPKMFAEHIEHRLATPPRGVMQFLREHLITCYIGSNKSEGKTPYCPTKQIDWEYGDLRQLNTTAPIATILKQEPYFYEALLFRVLYLLYDYSERIVENVKGQKTQRIGERSNASNPLLRDHFDPMEIQKIIGKEKAAAVFKSLRLLLSSPSAFSSYFFSDSNPLRSHSMLYKVAKSLPKVTEWLEEMLNFYTSSGKKLQDKVIQEWCDYFLKLEQEDLPSPPKKAPQDPLMLVDVTLCFLDLYYIFHTFQKQSHQLSIGYFGSTHIRGITHLLVKHLGWYEEVSNAVKGEAKTERCLNLSNTEWNLNDVK